jgi:hypothetical protein
VHLEGSREEQRLPEGAAGLGLDDLSGVGWACLRALHLAGRVVGPTAVTRRHAKPVGAAGPSGRDPISQDGAESPCAQGLSAGILEGEEASRMQSPAHFSDLAAAEAAATPTFKCSVCGYGVARSTPPERCPMCHNEGAWVHTSRRPFAHA